MELASCSWPGRTLFPSSCGGVSFSHGPSPMGTRGTPSSFFPAPVPVETHPSTDNTPSPSLAAWRRLGTERPSGSLQSGRELAVLGRRGLPEGFRVLLFVFILSFGGGLGIWRDRRLPLSGVQCLVLRAFISSLRREETASCGAWPATSDWSC